MTNSHQSKPVDDAVNVDVAVIGCGPTGATLANLLALSGISVLVVDREPAVYPLPRAVHFDDESMRVFQAVGIADALAAQSRVNPGMRFVDEHDRLLLDWPRPVDVGMHGWHGSYRLHQPALETLLRESLSHHDCVRIELGVQLVSVEEDDEFVNLLLQNVATESQIQCTARFVVGCDGANSLVRHYVGAHMEDLGFRERWLVVDVLLHSEQPELGDHTVQYCSTRQPMTYCRNPGLRRRWEMALPAELSDAHALEENRIWQTLKRWIQPEQAVIERKAVYTFKSELASRFRSGRLLIAGDAAHLTPPFMGQGMCAGIRDASNLAWKLAWCIRNPAHSFSRLLDSYQQERSPHVKQYINAAIQLGGLINSVDAKAVESLIESNDAEALRMASIKPAIGDSDWVLELFDTTHHQGAMCAQPCLADGTKLDDFTGYQFVFICRPELSAWGGLVPEGVAAGLVVLNTRDHPELEQLLDSMHQNAVLVRPDRYVLSGMLTLDEAQLTNRSLIGARLV